MQRPNNSSNGLVLGAKRNISTWMSNVQCATKVIKYNSVVHIQIYSTQIYAYVVYYCRELLISIPYGSVVHKIATL